jgi:S-adenosyl-L-methionine hydrolase (adenosine-forming)
MRPIALLTDFGLRDQYVGSLKCVIHSITPSATVFDLTHEIGPQNIREAAFVLGAIYPYAPRGTIFVVVVDPGVGSKRQAICVKTDRAYLVAPDNGVVSMALELTKKYEARFITNERFFVKPVSSTFHGRDIFSPVAARLSRQNIFKSLGPKAKKINLLRIPKAVRKGNRVVGEVIYVDRFGNAISNINLQLSPSGKGKVRHISLQETHQVPLRSFFSEARVHELLAVWNSNQQLELAVREGSAAAKYGVKVGDSVSVEF